MGTITNTQSMSRDLSTLVALAEVLADPAKLKELTEQMSAEVEIIQKAKADADQQLAEARRIQIQNSDLTVASNQQRVALEAAKADLKQRQEEHAVATRALEEAKVFHAARVKETEDSTRAANTAFQSKVNTFYAEADVRAKALAAKEDRLAARESTLNQRQTELDAAEKSYQQKMAKLKELAG